MSNKTREKKKWGIISKAILVIAAGIFIFAGYQIISIQLEYKQGDDEYAGLENDFVQKVDSNSDSIMQRVEDLGINTDEVVTDPTLNNSGIDVDFDALKAENPETVAWIHFPGVDISYPIMQTEDNDYYLKHTFKKEQNGNGSIFLDYQNSSDFTDDNTIIYGHNMKSGAMFGKLKRYRDEDFFADNSHFYILRPGFGADKYQVFSYYETDSLRQYTIAFANSEKKLEFLNDIAELSIYKSSTNIDISDKIITLVTCPDNRTSSNARFIVHARMAGK